MNLLKGQASYQLRVEGIHPMRGFPFRDGTLPSPWGHRFWMVYIDNHEHFQKAVTYVEDNPLKEGLRKQKWNFVTPYSP